MNFQISGTIDYITDGVGVEGRETFQVTRFPDGGRLLRAHSEMFNDRLTRDTLLTVNDRWEPQLAQLHLMLDNRYTGAGQYRFEQNAVRFDGHLADEGFVSDRRELASPAPAFAGHAVQNDAWLYAALEQHRADADHANLDGVVLSSRLPNGGDGPALKFSDQRHRFVGEEVVETPAGRFDTQHYEFLLADRPSIHYWISGPDFVFVRARWDLLRQTYELVDIDTREGAIV